MSKLTIYTDGAYSSSRDQGGLGIVFLKDNKKIYEYNNTMKNTTNNQMELAAVILALKAITKQYESITIFSDSMYVIGCASLGWKRKKNQEYWSLFDKQFERVKELCPDIQFCHVKGHDGNEWNEYCDKLAVKASQCLI